MFTHVAEPGQNGQFPSRRGRHPRTVAAGELCQLLGALGLSRTELAHLLGRASRTIRHWTFGSRVIPHEVVILLRLAHTGKITIADIVIAAQPRHDLEPIVGAIAEQEQEKASEAGIRIDQLDSSVCRWPMWGDDVPRDARLGNQMRFCGQTAVTGSPYCSEHAAMAARRGPGRPRSTLASPATGEVMNAAAHRL
jgi:hypothetical protein